MALGDLLQCALSIPFTPPTHIWKRWLVGATMCRAVGGVQAIGMFIGSFSLCAIAVDRYRRVGSSKTDRANLTTRGALAVMSLLWLLALLITLPYVLHMKLESYPGICGEFCTEEWPSDASKQLYTLFVLLVQSIIPFTIIAACYSALFVFFKRRARSRMSALTQQLNMLYLLAANADINHRTQVNVLNAQRQKLMAQRRQITLILLGMVVIFGLTTLPHNIVSLLFEFGGDGQLMRTADGTDLSYLINLFAHCVAMLSCATNPLLYAFLNPEFRSAIVEGVRSASPNLLLSSRMPSSFRVHHHNRDEEAERLHPSASNNNRPAEEADDVPLASAAAAAKTHETRAASVDNRHHYHNYLTVNGYGGAGGRHL